MSPKPLVGYDDLKQSAQKRRSEKTAKAIQKGVKKVNAKRGGHRFPAGVIPELRDFTRHQPCIIAGVAGHVCGYTLKTDLATGEPFYGSDPCHVEPEARGVGDFDNLFPGCRVTHNLQEGRTKWFNAKFGVNCKAAARRNTAKWLKEKGSGVGAGVGKDGT